ncbi:MAG: lipocalin-like domain-containing protein [Bacteroidaceae bacterium]|nr:lipocalin-like domain-containing protein [Bacteroidaceae bacterium]
MKRNILISILMVLALSACENKRDDNGPLGGMWQLTEWRSPEGTTLATKADQIFYSVQLKLIELRDYNDGTWGDYYLAYFRQTPDSLIIYRPVNYAKDSLVSLRDLARYGVPADGRFRIEALNRDMMILSSPAGTINFRKY